MKRGISIGALVCDIILGAFIGLAFIVFLCWAYFRG